jgi:hypothetical protein
MHTKQVNNSGRLANSLCKHFHKNHLLNELSGNAFVYLHTIFVYCD